MSTVKLKDGSELFIRLARAEDAAALALFKEAIGRESDFLSYGPGEIEISAATERQAILAAETAANSVMLLACQGREIVGFVTFSGSSRPRKSHSGELGIAVRQPYWGLGLGRSLMDALIAWARGTGAIRKINLVTRADNGTAIRLYEQCGFVKEGLLSRDVLINGVFYDALLMGLELDP